MISGTSSFLIWGIGESEQQCLRIRWCRCPRWERRSLRDVSAALCVSPCLRCVSLAARWEHCGVGTGGLKCSKERESSAFWFICYCTIMYCIMLPMLGDTQTLSCTVSCYPCLEILKPPLDTTLSLLLPCFEQELHQVISRGASNINSSVIHEKNYCSKAAVYLIFLIMACISTRHNSAKYVTSSGTRKVLHLFFFLLFFWALVMWNLDVLLLLCACSSSFLFYG